MKITTPRPQVSDADVTRVITDLLALAAALRKEHGAGAFMHPHEIVGMATGQLAKLSTVADAANYTDDGRDTRLRCLKFAYGLLFGAASLDVLARQNAPMDQNAGL